MCELCGTVEEVEAGRTSAARFADQLDQLSHRYRAMSTGRLKPHTDDMKHVGGTAKLVVRKLVEDWI